MSAPSGGEQGDIRAGQVGERLGLEIAPQVLDRVQMFAVLDDAIRCYQNNLAVLRPQARHVLAEAKEWLFRVSSSGPFSFESICEVLDIDARRLRRSLVRWRDQKLAAHQPRIVARRASAVHKERAIEHGFPGKREAVASLLRTAQRSSAVTKFLDKCLAGSNGRDLIDVHCNSGVVGRFRPLLRVVFLL